MQHLGGYFRKSSNNAGRIVLHPKIDIFEGDEKQYYGEK